MHKTLSITAFAASFLLTVFAGSQAAVARIHGSESGGDICSSEYFKEILEAIECKKNNCPDPDGKFDRFYRRACTQFDPSTIQRFGGNEIRIESDYSTQTGVLNSINDSYPILQRIIETHTDEPVNSTLLAPCDCLAKIEQRTKCGIELCKTDPSSQTPENPPPINPDPPIQPAKEVTPQRAEPVTEGGGLCSLGSGAGTMDVLGWIFLLGASGLLSYRRIRR